MGLSNQYDQYYLGQAGGNLPVFAGSRVQRGHGIGGILSGLMRMAAPLMKSGMKSLGKQGMKTGLQIAGDVMTGKKPKQAVKRRAKQAGLDVTARALQQLFPKPPGQPAKRGRQSTRGRSSTRGRQSGAIKRRAQCSDRSSSRASKRRRSADIFG